MVSAPTSTRVEAYGSAEAGHTVEASTSGIAWPPILGGAFAAAATSVILLALGSGFGLASVSPWPNSGASATGFTLMMAIWLIIAQWVSSGLGGYLTGRLRTKWVGVHTHEVFFRDTAHGFLAWAVAAVVGVAVLSSVASSLVSGVAHQAPTVGLVSADGANQGVLQANPSPSYVDRLFRSDHPNATNQDVRYEATRILAIGIRNGDLPTADRTYLAQLVAARTGLSQTDAEKRVEEVIVKEKADADAARKAGAYLAIFTAVSMLIGAFIAAAAAALGGRHRDEDWRGRPGLVR
jgi:hypothetical protein